MKKKKELNLIGEYYLLIDENGACVRITDTEAHAQFDKEKIEKLTHLNLRIEKVFSWSVKPENLLELITKVGSRNLKRRVNDNSGFDYFQIETQKKLNFNS